MLGFEIGFPKKKNMSKVAGHKLVIYYRFSDRAVHSVAPQPQPVTAATFFIDGASLLSPPLFREAFEHGSFLFHT